MGRPLASLRLRRSLKAGCTGRSGNWASDRTQTARVLIEPRCCMVRGCAGSYPIVSFIAEMRVAGVKARDVLIVEDLTRRPPLGASTERAPVSTGSHRSRPPPG